MRMRSNIDTDKILSKAYKKSYFFLKQKMGIMLAISLCYFKYSHTSINDRVHFRFNGLNVKRVDS